MLTVGVLEVFDLTVRDESSFISPYIRIRFYQLPKNVFKFGKDHVMNNFDMELQTKIQKASKNPVFNETFKVRMEERELKLYTIKLQLCDMDRLSRHVVLGETTVVTKKLNLLTSAELICQNLEQPVEVSQIYDDKLNQPMNISCNLEGIYIHTWESRFSQPNVESFQRKKMKGGCTN